MEFDWSLALIVVYFLAALGIGYAWRVAPAPKNDEENELIETYRQLNGKDRDTALSTVRTLALDAGLVTEASDAGGE